MNEQMKETEIPIQLAGYAEPATDWVGVILGLICGICAGIAIGIHWQALQRALS